MGRAGKAKLINRAIRNPLIARTSRFINYILISRFGLAVYPVHARALRKEWFDRCLYFQRLLDRLSDVEGDIVECGVASGRSLAVLASLVRSNGINRHVWGFDTWTGLPEPSEEDLTTQESFAEAGVFAYASKEMVIMNLHYYGFDDSEIEERVTLTQGLFSDTLPEYEGPGIALLHIDADLYNSYMDCLNNLWPKISTGGIVAFDEYQAYVQFPGAKKAVDDFLSRLPADSVTLQKDALYERYYAVKKI